jgi:hypothetical protein
MPKNRLKYSQFDLKTLTHEQKSNHFRGHRQHFGQNEVAIRVARFLLVQTYQNRKSTPNGHILY